MVVRLLLVLLMLLLLVLLLLEYKLLEYKNSFLLESERFHKVLDRKCFLELELDLRKRLEWLLIRMDCPFRQRKE